MSRVIVLMVSMLTSLAGCATHETYGNPALGEAERAVIEGYSWRYRLLYFEDLEIVSVDGKREGGPRGWPYASSVSVPSGRHWLQLLVLRNDRDIAMCAFEWTFEAGHRYRLRGIDHEQLLLAHPAAPRFPAAIPMSVTTAVSESPHEFTAPAECGKAAHCRQASDCPSSHECRMDENFRFGTCKP